MRVTPRGGVNRVDGVGPDGELRVRVSAAPAEGAANSALLRLIAEACDIAPSRVRIERGATARLKQVAVEDVAEDALRSRWPGLLLTRRD